MAWSAAHGNLLKKMGQEWSEYTRSMRNFPGDAVLDMSYDIAAMRFCYHQMLKHIHDYQAENVEWLLKQPKPLETLCSRWMSDRFVALDAEFDSFFRGIGYEQELESGVVMSVLS